MPALQAQASHRGGTYDLTAICAARCAEGFLLKNERVTLVLNDTTIELVLANRVALAHLRRFYSAIGGPANACYTVTSAGGRLRNVQLAHWFGFPGDDSSAVVTLVRSVDVLYRVLLTTSAGRVTATTPWRGGPAPDSIVQLTGVRSGPADPALCMHAAERLFTDNVTPDLDGPCGIYERAVVERLAIPDSVTVRGDSSTLFFESDRRFTFVTVGRDCVVKGHWYAPSQ